MEQPVDKQEISEPPASQIYPKPIVDGIMESLRQTDEGQLKPFISLKDMLSDNKEA